MTLRKWITLVEDARAEADAQANVDRYVADLKVLAKPPFVKKWVERQTRDAISDWGGPQPFFRTRAQSFAADMRGQIAFLNDHPPSHPDFDASDVRQMQLQYVIGTLVNHTKTPVVADWVRQAVPNRAKADDRFLDDLDASIAYFDEMVSYLNMHPPGSANVSIGDVRAAMAKRFSNQGDGGHSLTAQTDTAAFKAWFRDSKVVDTMGHPLVVFRGTHHPDEADSFKTKLNIPSFTTSPDVASIYAAKSSGVMGEPSYVSGSNVAPYYLSIQNPVVLPERVNLAGLISRLNANLADEDQAWSVANLLHDLSARTSYGSGHNHFEYSIASSDDDGHYTTFDELAGRIEELAEDGRDRDIYKLLKSVRLDAFAVADCDSFVSLARNNGFDGVIYHDPFEGGSGEAHLVGKAEDELIGVDDKTHLTYRPFSQSQIKSVWNRGTWDAEKASVSEGQHGLRRK